MNKKTILALTIGGVLFASNVTAAAKVADARGNAMGNTGVASADYLTAPFYNPALGASFKANDDFAMLLPAIGVSANDADDSLTTIDDIQSLMDNYDENSYEDIEQLETYLEQLDSNAPLSVSADLGFAIALPMNAVAINVFSRGYLELIASVAVGDTSDKSKLEESYEESTVDMLAFGYAEVGVAFAKEFAIKGERVSFGITPKFQQMTTYAQSGSIDDFEIDEYDESEVSKSAMNLDLGAMWYKNNFQVGIAVKDLLEQEIEVGGVAAANAIDTYMLDTQVTVAFAYYSDYFVAAVDADLTKQTRFQGVNDDTQFVRVGLEANAWGWAQLRAGYEIDLEETLDNSITAGIGLSPFDVISLDVAVSYAGENQLGAAANLAFTF